ncbi:MAG: hypothetical protein K5773_03260, partial [Pseudobutyrivibrio sp.]|nr:hypothetical protein [Pseudobutyrivibrio sp.]
DQADKEFWRRERIANSTPAKDISKLHYLTIPLDKFPFGFSSDPEIIAIENEIKELSDQEIVNFSGITNTELKTMYGLPNFEKLSQMGDCYDRLVVLLNSYAKILIDQGKTQEAIGILEYSVGTKTDVSESYILLADCYKANSEGKKLDLLKEQVNNSNLMLKDSILAKL